jgi:hypothetical protein
MLHCALNFNCSNPTRFCLRNGTAFEWLRTTSTLSAAAIRMARNAPGRVPPLLPRGVREEVHRPAGAVQDEQLPLAPDGGPGLADRDQEIPEAHRRWCLAEGQSGGTVQPARIRQHPYGGFYTQDEIREVVAYAAARHINVVPEIEMPGHAMAALAAYPHLGCTGGPYEVQTGWGVFEDVFCAGNDSTFAMLEDVLTEVMDLFPSPIHPHRRR